MGLVLGAAATSALVSLGGPARAEPRPSNQFALDLGGVRRGFVRAALGVDRPGAATRRLVLTAEVLTPSLAGIVDGFARGRPVKSDILLTSGAIIRKANGAALVSATLPSLGGGGSADVELGFDATTITTQPLLSPKKPPPSPAGARITGFRLDLGGMRAIEAPKLDAITITQRADGTVSTGQIGFDVGAGGAAPFVAWEKASKGKAPPRAMNIEYIGNDGALILELRLTRCALGSVRPMGASGTTRIAVTCAGARAR